MRIPVIHGIIDRRILTNFRVEAEVMSKNLPAPFRPKLIKGYAMAGVCLIRLKDIKPRFLPFPWGLRSENAAHRVAVEWDFEGQTKEGVYIPRRDTDSRLNSWVGGTLFPGEHHLAQFTVKETNESFSVALKSIDGDTQVHVSGKVTDQMPKSSLFSSIEEASAFFEAGALGYSVTKTPGRYDGLELQCKNWQLEPLQVEKVESSYFNDELKFPKGSVQFDCALLMRGIHHEWHGRGDLCCQSIK